MKAVEHWLRLPTEVVESLLLEIFQTQLDMVLKNVLSDQPVLRRGLDLMTSRCSPPLSLNHPVILFTLRLNDHLA